MKFIKESLLKEEIVLHYSSLTFDVADEYDWETNTYSYEPICRDIDYIVDEDDAISFLMYILELKDSNLYKELCTMPYEDFDNFFTTKKLHELVGKYYDDALEYFESSAIEFATEYYSNRY